MATITRREYQHLIRRQARVEQDVHILKQFLQRDDEAKIRPSVLKRWDRISRDLDRGKGRRFSSWRQARGWLKRL